jgi:hypothetical protein
MLLSPGSTTWLSGRTRRGIHRGHWRPGSGRDRPDSRSGYAGAGRLNVVLVGLLGSAVPC